MGIEVGQKIISTKKYLKGVISEINKGIGIFYVDYEDGTRGQFAIANYKDACVIEGTKKFEEFELIYSEKGEQVKREKKDEIQKRKEEIKRVLVERDIKYLVHFTRLSTLEIILDEGILPKSLVDPVHCNDEERLDGHKDYSCFTVEWPNVYLLKSNMENYYNEKWVLLLVDANILLEEERKAIFYTYNAATKECDCGETAEDFERMFASEARVKAYRDRSSGEFLYYRKREESLKAKFTTDVQAELQIKGGISPEHIKKVVFMHVDDKTSAMHKKLVDRGIEVVVKQSMFNVYTERK